MIEHVGDGRAAPAQIFVDDSGRRRRWVRGASAVATAVCLAYVGLVATDLAQTGVGPLITVPIGGNGLIPGFPGTTSVVPGLLTQNRTATVRRTTPPHTSQVVRVRRPPPGAPPAARPAPPAPPHDRGDPQGRRPPRDGVTW